LKDNRREKQISGGRVDRSAFFKSNFSIPSRLNSDMRVISRRCFLLARSIALKANIAKTKIAAATVIPMIAGIDKVADPTDTCLCMYLLMESPPAARMVGAIPAV
jgi:hypothetical protein